MKTKIAFISEHASPLAALGGVDSGGQNVYVAELARYLSRQGYDIDIFTRLENNGQDKIVNWLPGVRVIHVKAGAIQIISKEELLDHMPEFRNEMISFIQEEGLQYNLIHAHFFMSGWVACELKRLLKIPFVITFHALGIIRRIHQKGTDSFPEQRLKMELAAIERADQIIAECTQDWEDLTTHYNADPRKITIIPCGFCPDSFHPIAKKIARRYTGLPNDEKIILQLGRMVPRKGVDNVIESLAILNKSKLKIRLVIVGGNSDHPDPAACPELCRLQHIAKKLGILDAITFAGRKDRDILKYYYSAADLFVTTPWYEPFGITPLESMACGTPVVGSNVGGIKYSVAEGRTGFLVPANNPGALAEKVALLLNDDVLLQYMSRNCLMRVNTLFTWASVAEKTMYTYEQFKTPVMMKTVIPLWASSEEGRSQVKKATSSIVLNDQYAKSYIH